MKIIPIFSFKWLFIIGLCSGIISVSSYSIAISKEEPQLTLTESDRQQLLASVSKNAMLPIFSELALASTKLVKDVNYFCELKTESSLSAVRHSWSNTANAWQQADGLLFGPSVDDNIDFTIYFLPIKKGIVKGLLREGSLSTKTIESSGIGAQGLGALEYLLFSRELSLSEILQTFNKDPKACSYTVAVTELLHENISTISRQWKHYGVQFGLAGNSSLYFLESKEAMDLLVNKVYQSSQKVSNKKIGLLNNTKKLSSSTPYKLQAWRSGNSLNQVKANVTGIKRILEDGKILQWLNANKKKDIAKGLSLIINDILKQTVAGDDLFIVAKNTPQDLQSLVANTQKLTSLIKLQLAPSLGVELGFNDNDGD